MGKEISANPGIWHWLPEFRPPKKRIKGRESNAPLAKFGEKVYYHPAKRQTNKNDTVEPAWSEGMCLGLLWMGDEYAIVSRKRLIRAHSIK